MSDDMHWWVLRDLKRANAKLPAYRQLGEARFEVFVPTEEVLVTRGGKRFRERVPVIRDLLFVHASRVTLDAEVERTPTLQYRYVRGAAYRTPMTVRDVDMEYFIRAVRSSESPRYYLPSEVTPAMLGRSVHIVGGPLDGYEGHLLATRGSGARRLLVSLEGLLSVGVEVSPEYIRLV